MLGHNQLKVQLKSIKKHNTHPAAKATATTANANTITRKKKSAPNPCLSSAKPKSITKSIQKQSKPSMIIASKRASLKQMQANHTNIQSTLSSLNQFTPKNQKLQYIKSTHSNNLNLLNKQRISTASSIDKYKNGGDYATIFGLINSEIREITDLFKRTQSVDQQSKKDDLILKKTKGCFYNNLFVEDIDYVLFEKCLCEEEDKDEKEKVLDISNLEEGETKKMNVCDSVLFSSYNSELYRNLNKDQSGDILPELSSMSSRNVVKIAKANIFKNKHSRQKSNSIQVENGSDKTECQFTDVVFNNGNNNDNDNDNDINHSSSPSSNFSEKTCDMMEESEYKVHYVPIQEVMKQIRNYKSQPICIRKNKDE